MVKRYDAKDTIVTVNGTAITGLGENMVSWAKDEDYFKTNVGAQGDIAVSRINNDIHTLKITVQATSPQYSFLLGLQGSSNTCAVWCTNKKLGIRFGGELASIKQASELSWGVTAGEVEFTFTVFDGVTQG